MYCVKVISIATENNHCWDKGYTDIKYFGKKNQKKELCTIDNRNYTSLDKVDGFKYRYHAEKALNKVKTIFDENNKKYESWNSYFEIIEIN